MNFFSDKKENSVKKTERFVRARNTVRNKKKKLFESYKSGSNRYEVSRYTINPDLKRRIDLGFTEIYGIPYVAYVNPKSILIVSSRTQTYLRQMSSEKTEKEVLHNYH